MTTPIFRAPSSPAASPAHAYGVLRHGFASFYAAPVVEDMDDWRADVAFVGVPFDAGTNDRPGARFGPAAIRDASMRYRPEELWSGWIDAEQGTRVLGGVSMADVGDVNVRTVDLLENFDAITQTARMARRGARVPVFIGGDHAITFPLVRAFDDVPLTLVQFDAHQDYTDEKAGVRYSHDNHMRRSSELPHVRGIANIGLRGVIEHFEPYDAALRHGVTIVPAERIVRDGVDAALAPLTGGGPAYVTIDIDVLDPSGAPGTGYPEPGGITYYHLRDALRIVAARYDVIAFDVCEVDPIYDTAGVTTRIAAKLVLDFLAAIFSKQTA
jgi:agmatinase